MAPEPKLPAVSLSESRVAEGMELRDSSWGWAKRLEVSRRMRKRSAIRFNIFFILFFPIFFVCVFLCLLFGLSFSERSK